MPRLTSKGVSHGQSEIQQGEAYLKFVGEGMCGFWFEPLQIKYLGENEVNF